MVFSCDYLNTQILKNTIDKLNLLAGDPSKDGLQSTLHIDSATASQILKFEYESFVSEDDVVEMEVLREQLNNVAATKKDIVEKVISKLTIANKNAYLISVYVYDPRIVKSFEKALIEYFSNAEYISHRLKISRRNLELRREKLLSESRKLDSLKRALFINLQSISRQPNRGSNNVILGEETPINPLDVFKQDLEINDMILAIDRQLALGSDFEIIDGFSTHRQPESASLPKILIISFFVSWLMGYLIIGAWRFDQLLASYNTKKAQI
jgi:hypothetical protein